MRAETSPVDLDAESRVARVRLPEQILPQADGDHSLVGYQVYDPETVFIRLKASDGFGWEY